MSKTFGPVISELKNKEWGIFGPMSFQGYLEKYQLPAANTASKISVDSLERLSNDLRNAQSMVLRLGSSYDKPGSTQFAVIKTPCKLDDYFLHDEYCFSEQGPQTYLPEASFRSLFPYYVFPKLTENSMVNLAFTSGLIGQALELDKPYPTAAPATGKSTYTFRFYAHSEYPIELTHLNGQVEIDAVFVGRRNNQDCLFILETKAGTDKTLAKHKLVYPVLALAQYVPTDMPIIPIYMKVIKTGKDIQYHLVECCFPDPRKRVSAINELNMVRHKFLSLPIPQLV